MMRAKLMAAVVAFVVAGGAVVGASPMPQESVGEMKVQLAKLKAQVAELEAKIAAAEGQGQAGGAAAAAGSVPPVVTALNAMPKNLWPGENDTPIKENLRDKWLAENVKPGTEYTFTGSVFMSSPNTLNEAGKPPVECVNVIVDCGKHLVWGQEKEVKVIGVIRNVKPEDAVDWSEKTVITVTGKCNSYGSGGSTMDVRMDTMVKK